VIDARRRVVLAYPEYASDSAARRCIPPSVPIAEEGKGASLGRAAGYSEEEEEEEEEEDCETERSSMVERTPGR
jgi:hypothetical protein